LTVLGLLTATGACSSEGVRLGGGQHHDLGQIGSAVELAPGDFGMCARTSEQIVVCWRAGYPYTVSIVRELGRPERLVSAGTSGYTCTIQGGGRLACRDTDAGGPLTPVDVAGARDVSVGYWGGCALDQQNQMLCWGNAATGINGGFSEGLIPALRDVELKHLPRPAVQVAYNEQHGCAVLDDGRVFCHGINDYGVVDGNPTYDISGLHLFVEPVELSGVTDAAQVSVSAETTCVLHRTGRVSCVGAISKPELGEGRYQSERGELPLQDVTQISSSRWTTCALTAAGEVYCWGSGDCDLVTHVEGDNSWTPRRVTGFEPAKAFRLADEALLCIIDFDDKVSCRGFRWDYEIGTSVCESTVYNVSL
jgi:hypothetical protein